MKEKVWLSNETYKSCNVFTIALDEVIWVAVFKAFSSTAPFLSRLYSYLKEVQNGRTLLTCGAKDVFNFTKSNGTPSYLNKTRG